MSEDRSSPNPRFGPWKFIHEISLKDMLDHPVWVWCMELHEPDGPIGGDETSMRPLLGSDEVPLDHVSPPLILLRIKGTKHRASGLYYTEKKVLESISVFIGNDVSGPGELPDLPEPAVYAAAPSIGGQRDVEFESISRGSDEARQKP